ncbi:MAG: cysteine desulfurase [Spirochaetales bacterium]|nr:cysteine desulfurase [Spirochaetales bacterium]
MSKRQVYLDYNATTPLHPEVKKALHAALDLYANPSSMHEFGRSVRNRLEHVRQAIADFIGAKPEEIIYTAGGSESNNTVLKIISCARCGGLDFGQGRNEIITTSIEHPSIIQTAQHLESLGNTVHYLKVDKYGRVDVDHFLELISHRTALVSIMYANNEIGTVQDIKALTEIAHRYGAFFHTDAVQAVGKIPVNVAELDVDYLSFSAHKFYGPKGVGVLYVKKAKPYYALLHGGHQEGGRRAGTMNSLGIMGMGRAVELIRSEMEEIKQRLKNYKAKLRIEISKQIPDVTFNGHPEYNLENTLNVSFHGAEGEAILLYLDLEGIAVSTGSACSSGSLEPSHVLLATGVGPELAHGSIRFSLGRETTEDEIDYVLDKLPAVIAKVRKMSTVYSGECK